MATQSPPAPRMRAVGEAWTRALRLEEELAKGHPRPKLCGSRNLGGEEWGRLPRASLQLLWGRRDTHPRRGGAGWLLLHGHARTRALRLLFFLLLFSFSRSKLGQGVEVSSGIAAPGSDANQKPLAFFIFPSPGLLESVATLHGRVELPCLAPWSVPRAPVTVALARALQSGAARSLPAGRRGRDRSPR